ncbi:hypothetical protein BZG36_01835 [Bifiguratus adelaidae]|uniref:PX domain-containing protein n=1 Tax=Bifiguratus adelaidae TaxID=1938954 RepID=A0A261Y2A8_9FUNG|nr:hypothetical protein BZG36_01835 [Bifiguratus adelaidae]
MEAVHAIFVRSAETRSNPKPHTEYRIEIQGPIRTWNVWKRYSEFDRLNSEFARQFPKTPTPAPLPPKNYFSSTLKNAELVEERRKGLEAYLRAILASRDDRWRETPEWKAFLAIPTGRALDTASSYTSESWLDEQRELSNSTRQIRSLLNARETHLARNEVSMVHNNTMQAKKMLVTLSTRLTSLENGLTALAKGSASESRVLSEGELRRRTDMVNELKEERDSLNKLVNTGRQNNALLNATSHPSSPAKPAERRALLSNKNGEGNGWSGDVGFRSMPKSPDIKPATSRRVFGNPNALKETPQTMGLDNDQLLQLQNQMMDDQDAQVEQFSSILTRQKQIGLAIGDELDEQNQMLDELDTSVGKSKAKLTFAQKKLNKIK